MDLTERLKEQAITDLHSIGIGIDEDFEVAEILAAEMPKLDQFLDADKMKKIRKFIQHKRNEMEVTNG